MAYNNTKVKERQVTTQSAQTQQLGIVSEVPMDAWSADVSYEKLNIVTYNNGTYLAKRTNKGVPPLTGEDWGSCWMPLLNGVGITSIITEYAQSNSQTSAPTGGWASTMPDVSFGNYLWLRITITYTNGRQDIIYMTGAGGVPVKTSQLANDGDGTSPFATQADLGGYLPLTGGTLSGSLKVGSAASVGTNGYITGTWLQTTSSSHLAAAATRIAVLDSQGWVYYRTPEDILGDIGGASAANLTALGGRVSTIEGKIPAQASNTNQLADKAFVNSSINALAAYFITPTAAGDTAFATRAELLAAKTFYSGGKTRVPTQNDYAVVLADESQTKGVDGSYPTTRYSYQGGTYPNGQWSFQYIVNNTSLTQAQIAALNSGITAAGVAQITTNKNDIAALKTTAGTAVQTVTASNGITAIKSGTGITISGVAADTNTVGVARLHPAANCSTYTSDNGGATPAAVKKAFVDESVASIFNATSTHSGRMSKEDKAKLDKFGEAGTYALKTELNSVKTTADNAMPKSGGQFVGQVSWADGALPSKTSPKYFLTIDAFAEGGTTYYTSLANAKTTLGITDLEKRAGNFVTTDTEQVISATKVISADALTQSGTVLKSGSVQILHLDDFGDSDKAVSATYYGDRIRYQSADGGNYYLIFPKKEGTFALTSDIPNVKITDSGTGNAVTAITASGHTITVTKGATFATTAELNAVAGAAIPASEKGEAGGVATLDGTGKVPAAQLPSYVDDVLEYDNKAGFPKEGEDGKIYIAKDTNLQYRWSGSQYVEISSSLALGETANTAYAGNKGKANADAIAALQERATAIEKDNTTQNAAIKQAQATADNAMPKSGGTFTGTVKWDNEALEQKSGLDYFLGVAEQPKAGVEAETCYVTREDVKTYLGVDTAQAAAEKAQKAAEAAQKTADGKYSLPDGGIPASDLAGGIPASKTTGFAKVATSGSYNDLKDKPFTDEGLSLPNGTIKAKAFVTYDANGAEGTRYENGRVIVPNASLPALPYTVSFPAATGTVALTSDLNGYVSKSAGGDVDASVNVLHSENKNGFGVYFGGGASAVASHTIYGNHEITYNPGSGTGVPVEDIIITLPSGAGTLALKEDIPSLDGYVKKTGSNMTGGLVLMPTSSASGVNQGMYGIELNIDATNGTAGVRVHPDADENETFSPKAFAVYKATKIVITNTSGEVLRTLKFPVKDGTFALTSDIPETPSISASTTGNGNAITSITATGHTIRATRGQTFALKTDLPDLSNVVTTDTEQEITANKTFGSADGEHLTVSSSNVAIYGSALLGSTYYGLTDIKRVVGNAVFTLTLPQITDTIATKRDLTSYVTTDTEQNVTGRKTFQTPDLSGTLFTGQGASGAADTTVEISPHSGSTVSSHMYGVIVANGPYSKTTHRGANETAVFYSSGIRFYKASANSGYVDLTYDGTPVSSAPGGRTAVKIPNKSGTLATLDDISWANISGKPEIPDTSNFVTIDTAQHIKGEKTFDDRLWVTDGESKSVLSHSGLGYQNANGDQFSYAFPEESGTLALEHPTYTFAYVKSDSDTETINKNNNVFMSLATDFKQARNINYPALIYATKEDDNGDISRMTPLYNLQAAALSGDISLIFKFGEHDFWRANFNMRTGSSTYENLDNYLPPLHISLVSANAEEYREPERFEGVIPYVASQFLIADTLDLRPTDEIVCAKWKLKTHNNPKYANRTRKSSIAKRVVESRPFSAITTKKTVGGYKFDLEWGIDTSERLERGYAYGYKWERLMFWIRRPNENDRGHNYHRVSNIITVNYMPKISEHRQHGMVQLLSE